MLFTDVKGHARPIEILKGYLRCDRLPGGFLFTGPDGIGKRAVAKIFAKALNCLERPGEGCAACRSCAKIEKEEHPDVHFPGREADAVKIEEIRRLQREISLRPYEGRKKVFIVDNAHTLTAEAANAILKVLEEPPAASLIVLVTAKPSLLFKTILSRCQLVRFGPLGRPALADILHAEHGMLAPEARYLAFFSEGRLGRALELSATDLVNRRNRVIDAFLSGGERPVPETLVHQKEDFRSSLNILAAWFRDLSFLKAGMPHAELINADRAADLLQQMSRYSSSELEEIIAGLAQSLLYLEQNVNVKLLLSHLRCELTRG